VKEKNHDLPGGKRRRAIFTLHTIWKSRPFRETESHLYSTHHMEKPTLQKEREPSLLYTPYGKADPSERKSSIFTRHMEKPTLQRERVPSLHAIWKLALIHN
jgi:hypothetical protein